MIVLSHRGFWRTPDEKNGLVALRRSVDEGFGTETDFRDLAGQLVIAHDPPALDALKASEAVALFVGTGLTIAVNVKSDGIGGMLEESFRDHDVPWFAFDMSAPETLRYAKLGLPFMTRHSDVEPQPILYEAASGVWLDAFHTDWFDAKVIDRHLTSGKQVCIVSPELHGRDPRPVWDRLDLLKDHGDLMLCTDMPDQARRRFS